MRVNFFVRSAVLFCMTVFLWNNASAAIDVKAGEPGKVILTVETQARVGKPFTVRIEIRDDYDNILTNFHQMGRPIKLTTTGSGKLNPGIVVPSEFIEGVAQMSLTYNKAEAITIVATEEVSGKSAEAKVVIGSGKVNQFVVSAPSSIVVGRNFSLKIEARDVYGNLVTDYNLKNKGVEITMASGKIAPGIVPASNFVNGVASVEVKCMKGQAGAIYVMDIVERAYGKSATINVEPSEVKRFIVSTPVQGVAGEVFTVRIEAYDASGNLVTNYDKTGRGILITPQGQGKITPNEIPASVFVDGIATVSLSYDKAEPLELIITEKPRQQPAVKTEEKTREETTKPVKKEVVKPTAEEKKEAVPATAVEKPKVAPPAFLRKQEGGTKVGTLEVEGEVPKEAAKPAEKKEDVTPVVEKPRVGTLEVPKEESAQSRVEEAKACYERAVRAINLNKYEEAKKELEKCIALDPNNAEAKKLLERLNTIIKLETR